MLLVAKIGRHRAGYYLEHLTPSDEPSGGFTERPGRWVGALANLLGLEGSVEATSLRRVLASRHPVDGAPLHAAADRVRVAAFDCTFTAPKSVSLLHALSAPEVCGEVAAAHRAAVEAGLAYLAAHGLAVRRHHGGRSRQEPVARMLAAVFVHRTSRAGDPHLHTHALVANLAADADGLLRALDGRPLYLHLSSASALYDAALRAELSRALGVAWRVRPGGGYDLAGLPDTTLEAFSTRRRQIIAELEASGRGGRRAAEIASRRTRPAKDPGTSYAELVALWREAAYDLGISDGRWHAVLGPGRDAPDGPGSGATSSEVASVVAVAADRFEAPFTRRTLIEEAARAFPPGAGAPVLERAVDGLLGAPGALQSLGDRPAVLAGRQGSFPAGGSEGVFRTARLARTEAALAAELAYLESREPALGGAPGAFGRQVLAVPERRLLEALAALGGRAREASAAGLTVRAHAPTAREAAAFSALTGVPATSGAAPPMPSPTGLLLVVGADRLALSSLEQVLAVARARSAHLGLVVSPSPPRGVRPPAPRKLLLAAARRIEASAWTADGLAPRVHRLEAAGGLHLAEHAEPSGAHGWAELADLETAVAFALGTLSSRRERGERAVLVAPDRPIAAALERLVPTRVRSGFAAIPTVVHAGALLSGSGEAEAFVVLGREVDLDRRTLGVAVTPLAPLERPFAARSVARERRTGRSVETIPGNSRTRDEHGRAPGRPSDRGIGR